MVSFRSLRLFRLFRRFRFGCFVSLVSLVSVVSFRFVVSGFSTCLCKHLLFSVVASSSANGSQSAIKEANSQLLKRSIKIFRSLPNENLLCFPCQNVSDFETRFGPFSSKIYYNVEIEKMQRTGHDGGAPCNKPRSIYQYSNMAPRLSGQPSLFGVVLFAFKVYFGN